MGFRYRKSVKLPLGFRVNFSKSGVGCSWGTKGYRKTLTANGKVRTTYSIPGTGISYVDEKSTKQTNQKEKKSSPDESITTTASDNRNVSSKSNTTPNTSKKSNTLWIIAAVVLLGLCILFIFDGSDTVEPISNTSNSQSELIENTNTSLPIVTLDNNSNIVKTHTPDLINDSDLPTSEPIVAVNNKAELNNDKTVTENLIPANDNNILDGEKAITENIIPANVNNALNDEKAITENIISTNDNTELNSEKTNNESVIADSVISQTEPIIATSQSSLIPDDIVITDNVVDLDDDTISAIKDIFTNTTGVDRAETLQKLSNLYINRK